MNVSGLPNMFAFIGYTGTTEGEAAYAYMYTIDGKMHGANRHWRQVNKFTIPGICELTESYHNLKFITYKDSTMYRYGSAEGTRIPAGTVYNVGDGYNLMNRYFVFD